MKGRKLIVWLATAAVALAAASAALAGGHNGKVLYRFVGELQGPPAGTSLTVSVQGGNRAALRAMLGQSQVQTFATGSGTVFLEWEHAKPTVAQIGDLTPGHRVAVNIRAPRGSSLAELLATAARTVADHAAWSKPSKPLYLFRGTLVSTSEGRVTIDVKGGNHRALQLILGQSSQQTFTTGGETVFLHWQGPIPTVVGASDLEVGERVVVRVRADRGSTLAEVEATAARRVAEHEPRAQETAQNAQA